MAFICCIYQDHIQNTTEKAIMNTTRGDQTDDVVCFYQHKRHIHEKKPPDKYSRSNRQREWILQKITKQRDTTMKKHEKTDDVDEKR